MLLIKPIIMQSMPIMPIIMPTILDYRHHNCLIVVMLRAFSLVLGFAHRALGVLLRVIVPFAEDDDASDDDDDDSDDHV